MALAGELTRQKSYLGPSDGAMRIRRFGERRPGRAEIMGKQVEQTKRRIEITVEKHRVVMLSNRNHSMRAWCRTCGEEVQMVTPDEAAQRCQVSTRTIYRWIEIGQLHFTETENGFSLVCHQSLESKMNPASGLSEPAVRGRARGFLRKNLMKRMLKRR